MARKPRMTVFSKFMLLMLVVGPLSYMAASYYNGEDGIQNIKNLVSKGKEKVTTPVTTPPPPTPVEVTKKEEKMDGYEIQKLKRQLEDLDAENRQLKRKVRDLEQELQKSKSKG